MLMTGWEHAFLQNHMCQTRQLSSVAWIPVASVTLG